MADDPEYNAVEAAEKKKSRTFRKFSYRGIDLDAYVVPPETISSPTSTPDIYLAVVERNSQEGIRRDQLANIFLRTVYWISTLSSSAMSSTLVPAAESTEASSASPWA
jgi:hypothetical protein